MKILYQREFSAKTMSDEKVYGIKHESQQLPNGLDKELISTSIGLR